MNKSYSDQYESLEHDDAKAYKTLFIDDLLGKFELVVEGVKLDGEVSASFTRIGFGAIDLDSLNIGQLDVMSDDGTSLPLDMSKCPKEFYSKIETALTTEAKRRGATALPEQWQLVDFNE